MEAGQESQLDGKFKDRQEEINLGYYIVEDVNKPTFISLSCERLISASPCICTMHPDLQGCFWLGYKDKKKAYQKMLGLSDTEYKEMQDKVAELFSNGLIGVDSRFFDLNTAMQFYKMYLKKFANMHIISITTTDKYFQVITEDDREAAEKLGRITPDSCSGNFERYSNNFESCSSDVERYSGDVVKKYIGCEIIGYDFYSDSPHSYLCNHLDEELLCCGLKCSDYGLIANDFIKAEEFAGLIQGKGEPVEWIPVKIYEYECKEYE